MLISLRSKPCHRIISWIKIRLYEIRHLPTVAECHRNDGYNGSHRGEQNVECVPWGKSHYAGSLTILQLLHRWSKDADRLPKIRNRRSVSRNHSLFRVRDTLLEDIACIILLSELITENVNRSNFCVDETGETASRLLFRERASVAGKRTY